MEQRVRIEGLIDKYEAAISECGFGYSTRLRMLTRADIIISMHKRQGVDYLDDGIIANYFHELEERYYNGKISSRII